MPKCKLQIKTRNVRLARIMKRIQYAIYTPNLKSLVMQAFYFRAFNFKFSCFCNLKTSKKIFFI
jgi:hypothetical protein